jgi:hypothetical protein
MRLENQDSNPCQPWFCNFLIFEAEMLQDNVISVAKYQKRVAEFLSGWAAVGYEILV